MIHKTICFVCFLLLIGIPVVCSAGDLNIPPIFYHDQDEAYKTEENLLGPFITIRKNDERNEFGIRPFFYWLENEKRDHREMDILYPLFGYWADSDIKSYQFLLHLVKYESNKLKGGTEREFTLFPFIFYKSSPEKDNGYFGLFPLYGDLNNKFSKDTIQFILFPLYMKTTSEGDKTTSIVWPFISIYSGDQEGFRLWPIYGKRTKKKNNLEQTFIMWPFYVSNEKDFYGQHIYSRNFFPFYSESEMFGIKHRSYFWPLYNKTESINNNFERWDVPWPFINITRGKKYQTRVFPFYSRSESAEEDTDGFILWPLYKYSKLHLEDHIRSKKIFLFFIFKEETYKPTIDGGKKGKRIDLWPLFTYTKNRNSSYLHVFTLFEPFIRSSDRLYRNYSPFWRIFEWRKYDDDSSKASLLWDIITLRNSERGSKFSIKPVIPLVTYRNMDVGNSFKLLGGLIGYSSSDYGDTIRLFYYPFRFNKDKNREEGSRKE